MRYVVTAAVVAVANGWNIGIFFLLGWGEIVYFKPTLSIGLFLDSN
jgi:hypothetical protein